MLVDLEWRVTIGKNIQQVIDGHEVETGEGLTLGVQIFIECLLADLQLSLDFIQSLVHTIDSTKLEDVLDLSSLLHNLTHVLVDTHELVADLGQLLLHLLRMDEQIFQERPGLLHITEQLDHVIYATEILLPLFEEFFEEGYEFG